MKIGMKSILWFHYNGMKSKNAQAHLWHRNHLGALGDCDWKEDFPKVTNVISCLEW